MGYDWLEGWEMAEYMVEENGVYYSGGENVMNGKIEVRFGWDAFARQYSGGLLGGLLRGSAAIDCDACAVFCDVDGKLLSGKKEDTCLSYANETLFDGAALHHGDNRTGEGVDDEMISLDLDRLPEQVGEIWLTLDLFKEKKRIRPGMLQNTFVRILRSEDGEELDRFDFNGLGAGSELALGGVLRRGNGGWVFERKGEARSERSMEEFLEKMNLKKKNLKR